MTYLEDLKARKTAEKRKLEEAREAHDGAEVLILLASCSRLEQQIVMTEHLEKRHVKYRGNGIYFVPFADCVEADIDVELRTIRFHFVKNDLCGDFLSRYFGGKKENADRWLTRYISDKWEMLIRNDELRYIPEGLWGTPEPKFENFFPHPGADCGNLVSAFRTSLDFLLGIGEAGLMSAYIVDELNDYLGLLQYGPRGITKAYREVQNEREK